MSAPIGPANTDIKTTGFAQSVIQMSVRTQKMVGAGMLRSTYAFAAKILSMIAWITHQLRLSSLLLAA